MAMTMSGEVQLPAPREAVWAKLNDPEVLKACIPGCEELEKTDEHGFRAVAKMKVGPVSARFKGKVTLSDLDPPNGYKISGEGSGGAAGFAKGGATVKLSDDGDGTLLSYTVEANVGGKLAQIGSRLIDATARKMAGDFFQRFAQAVDSASPAPPPASAPPAPAPIAVGAAPAPAASISSGGTAATPAPAEHKESPRPRMAPVMWVTLLALVVAVLLYYFTGRGH